MPWHHAAMTAHLSALHLFPLKSGAPLPVDSALVEPRGLRHDRRWMAVDDGGRFITGREEARLTLLRALPREDGGLDLAAPDMPPLRLAPPSGPRLAVTVWRSTVEALVADAEANAWLSDFLRRPARFVHMDPAATRAVASEYGRTGDEVSFADGFPLLLISQAALDQLNTRLAQPVPMLRFRPNLVVAGTAPHAEDRWQRVRIGGIDFDVVKPCTRCVFTTVDFQRGERCADGEPLRTLATYRREAAGVTFGQNLIPRGSGTLRVGAMVEPMD